jgi:hypothetical protein
MRTRSISAGASPHMTAQPNPASDRPQPDQPADEYRLDHHSGAIVAGGDVPIAVWRLDDTDPDLTVDPAERLAARLAQRLILLYTRRGDAIVDFDCDPHLRTACAGLAREYLAITDPSDVAELDSLSAPISLIVLRTPPHNASQSPDSITDLFAACRLIMTADTCTVASVSGAQLGTPGTSYVERAHEWVVAARAAKLEDVLHIVAVASPGFGDRFLYYATPEEADDARTGRHDMPAGSSHHVDLILFANRRKRREQPSGQRRGEDHASAWTATNASSVTAEPLD